MTKNKIVIFLMVLCVGCNITKDVIAPDTYYSAGIEYLKIGNKEKAIESLQKAIGIDPLSGKSYYLIGVIKSGMPGKILDIKMYYEKAIELEPYNVSYRIGYAIFCNNNGYHTTGIDMLKKVLNLHPENSLAAYNLGVSYEVIKNYDAAIKYYKMSIDSDKTFNYPYVNLGVLLIKKGQKEEGIWYLEEAKKLSKEDKGVKIISDIIKSSLEEKA